MYISYGFGFSSPLCIIHARGRQASSFIVSMVLSKSSVGCLLGCLRCLRLDSTAILFYALFLKHLLSPVYCIDGLIRCFQIISFIFLRIGSNLPIYMLVSDWLLFCDPAVWFLANLLFATHLPAGRKTLLWFGYNINLLSKWRRCQPNNQFDQIFIMGNIISFLRFAKIV